jgi:hypothetical protein
MAVAIQSSPVAILRILRQFFETDLCGMCRWDAVRIDREEENRVEIGFSVGKGRYRITVNPPGDDPPFPLGRVLLIGAQAHIEGPLDSVTWARIAQAIKEHAPTVEHLTEWE